MKRRTPTLAAMAMVVAMMAGAAAAQTNTLGKLTGSKHDLNTWGNGLVIPGNQICLPCHTPHGGNNEVEEGRFLWNHKVSTKSFTLYTAKFTGTRFGKTSSANPVLDGESKMCLSCHDGVTALDAFGGSDGTNKVMTGTRAVGADDLSNDHPIGIKYPGLNDAGTTWDASKGSGYFDPTQPTWTTPTDRNSFTGGAAVKLVDLSPGVVGIGCGSCHTPHSNKFKYLRMSNDGSALCFKCHDK